MVDISNVFLINVVIFLSTTVLRPLIMNKPATRQYIYIPAHLDNGIRAIAMYQLFICKCNMRIVYIQGLAYTPTHEGHDGISQCGNHTPTFIQSSKYKRNYHLFLNQ